MSEPGPPQSPSPQRRARQLTESLAARLFALTLGAILLTEALIFVPSASNVRTQWLSERVQAARIAALALEAAPMREVSEELSESLLERAEVLAVTEVEDEMRRPALWICARPQCWARAQPPSASILRQAARCW